MEAPNQLPSRKHRFLKRLLLFRARMHLGELDRVLSQLLSAKPAKLPPNRPYADAEPAISLDDESVLQNRGYRISVFYQFSVEFLMQDEDLKSRLRQDPDFVQSVYDALYYPARRWESREAVVVSSAAFEGYLRGRRGLDVPTTPKEEVPPNPDLPLLESRMRQVLQLLEQPRGLIDKIDERISDFLLRHDKQALDAAKGDKQQIISAATNSKRLKESADGPSVASLIDLHSDLRELPDVPQVVSRGETERYMWLFDEFGLQLSSPAMVAVDIATTIQSLDLFLSENGCDLQMLANQYHIIGDKPEWPTVQAALGDHTKIVDNRNQLLAAEALAFWQMLQDFGVVLRTGLYYAALYAAGLPFRPKLFLKHGLDELKKLTHLSIDSTASDRVTRLEDAYKKHLANIDADLHQKTMGTIRAAWLEMSSLEAGDIAGWLPKMKTVVTKVSDQSPIHRG